MSIHITLLFLISVAVTVVSGFYPADNYLLDCGSTTSTTIDIDHRRFTGDDSSPILSATHSVAVKNSNPDSSLSPVYHTARVFTRPSSYRFKISEKGNHLVRLHFQRFDLFGKINTCHARFHVSANGRVLLYNFTVTQKTPRIKDFLIWVDDEELVIRFIPGEKSSFAFVNAIEVISAPKDLIADVAQFVSLEQNKRIDGLSKYSYENLYRVNIGGVKVTPFNDSLWRTWVPDDEFFKLNDGSRMEYQKIHFGGRIEYQLGGASREVCPDNVYNSARLISSSDNLVPNLNITWVFPVTEGFKYLVRLHFCDIASVTLGLIYFNVYVNGHLAYENLDLTTLTNQLASPFYADFVVDSGEPSGVIRVDVGPSNWSKPYAVDAILNGLEIWKMNNSMGSLDGEVLAEQLFSKNQSGGNISRLLSLSGAVCLLVVAFLVMHRRRTNIKDSVGWSRLPVDVSEIDLKSNHAKSSAGDI